MVDAALTHRSSAQVRSMRFEQLPPEMQISTGGHWNLGPDRLGPWLWVCELCLVDGELVFITEGRPGRPDPPPPAP